MKRIYVVFLMYRVLACWCNMTTLRRHSTRSRILAYIALLVEAYTIVYM